MDARWVTTVAYLDNLFGPHVDNLSRSMNLSTQRQGLLLKNLANVNTPNYKRQDLDFNLTLQEAMGDKPAADEDKAFNTAFETGHFRNESNESSIRLDGNNVDLEREIQSIAETELRFNTLTDLTSRYFSGLKNVIREGR